MNNLLWLHFIKQLNDFYGKSPYGHGFALRLKEFEGYDAEALELAAKNLLERKSKTYPTLGDCQQALRAVRRAGPATAATTSGYTAKSYQEAAHSYAKARGRFHGLTEADKEALEAWLAYFRQIGLHGMVARCLDAMERRTKGLTVPTRFPWEFDATAPVTISSDQGDQRRAA